MATKTNNGTIKMTRAELKNLYESFTQSEEEVDLTKMFGGIKSQPAPAPRQVNNSSPDLARFEAIIQKQQKLIEALQTSLAKQTQVQKPETPNFDEQSFRQLPDGRIVSEAVYNQYLEVQRQKFREQGYDPTVIFEGTEPFQEDTFSGISQSLYNESMKSRMYGSGQILPGISVKNRAPPPDVDLSQPQGKSLQVPATVGPDGKLMLEIPQSQFARMAPQQQPQVVRNSSLDTPISQQPQYMMQQQQAQARVQQAKQQAMLAEQRQSRPVAPPAPKRPQPPVPKPVEKSTTPAPTTSWNNMISLNKKNNVSR